MTRKSEELRVGPTGVPTNLSEAEAFDAADPLAHARTRFSLPRGVIYLDGHSLGPPSVDALARIAQTANLEWGEGLIRSWNSAGWIDLPQRIAAKLAPLLGVASDDVIVCDSVSVNLFKLAAAALGEARAREIVAEADEFPTDQYVAESLAEFAGAQFRRVAPGEGKGALAGGGVLLKSLVNYRTAAIADVASLEEAARASGALIIWDLSHATGVLDLKLEDWGVRLAVGCTYKYLNGGPGAPAYLYAQPDLADRMRSPIAGWFGHADAFAFSSDYAPLPGAARFAAGTPPILSLVALDAALDGFADCAPKQLQDKARTLGAMWMQRADALGLATSSPREDWLRGGHVTLLHPEGYAIMQALIARGVIGDFRPPDAMRFGFSPLFLSYAEVWRAFDVLRDVLATEAWRDPAYTRRGKVT